jgi:hypothetical protein
MSDSGDLWLAASADTEAEQAHLRMGRAKVAVASLWPFLAMARSAGEFEHRLALADEQIIARVEPAMVEPVVASLREDFGRMASVHVAEDTKDDYEPDKPKKSTHESSEDDEDDPDYWKSLVKSKEGSREHDEYDHKRSEQLNHLLGPSYHSNDFGGHGRMPWGGMQEPHDEDIPWGETKDEQAHWPNAPASETGSWIDNFDPMEHGSRENRSSLTPQSQPFRSLNSLHTAQYFDAGLGRWVALDDDSNAGKGNPAYPPKMVEGPPEQGPETWETGTFPQFPGGPDNHYDPINAQYDHEAPQPWVVPPGGEWKDQPMSFAPYKASRLPFAQAAEVLKSDRCEDCGHPVEHVKTVDGDRFWSHGGADGQQADADHMPWPSGRTAAYFDQGSEGVAGDQQSGFPEDVALDEPDYQVDSYGNPPEQSHGSTGQGIDSQYHSGSLAPNVFYDPQDSSVRMVRVADASADPFGAGNPFTPPNSTGTSEQPGDNTSPPPVMNGGPGAQAMPAMTPQTTPPAQIPSGGGGGGGGMPGGMGGAGGGANPNTPTPNTTTGRRHVGESRNVFSDDDPTGLGDDFAETQIDNQQRQRPRQAPNGAGGRNPSTPQGRQKPIPTLTTSVPAPGAEDEEEEED